MSVEEPRSELLHTEPLHLPRPRLAKTRWPWIWLVPLCALAAAGAYVYLHYQEQGLVITIRLNDADGLRIGQTPVTMRGVEIGKVKDLELTEDHQHVWVRVALQQKYASIASEGALFWVVKADITDGMITGLGTVVSGPYIEAEPGVGKPQTVFVGLEHQPVSLGGGLIVILHADRLEHLQPGSPIFYRGIQVGTVESIHFARDATHVNINAVIRERFASLVTTATQFWRISGADVKGGIFSGVSVKLDSLRTLLNGGIEFATPEERTVQAAQDGAQFELHDEPKKDWLGWAPKVRLPPEALSEPESGPQPDGAGRLGSTVSQKQQGN